MNQMEDRQVIQSYQQNDEIDLKSLLRNMWAVRGPVILAVIIVTLGYWGFWAANQLLAPSPSTYSRVIQFTFEGAEKGEYPNETPFRIADVVSPAVLAQVYEINQLSELGISQANFVQSFNIQPYAPDYNIIVAKYESAMSRKNITGEEINALQANMKSELEQAQGRSALISFKPIKKIRLNENVIDKVLLDVPRLWAEKAINSDGVTNLDVTIYSSKMFDDQRFESLDYMIAMDLVQDNVRLIKSNIEKLLERPNGAVVKDDQSSFGLPDLEKAIDDVVTYDLQQLITPIQDLGVTKNAEIVKLYYQGEMRKVEQERQFELDQAELIRETLSQYGQNLAGDRSAGGSGAVAGSPQLGDEFLDRVIDLTQKGADMEYRQSLTDKILEHRQNAAELKYKLEQMQVVLNAVSSKQEKSESEERYIELLEKSFPAILGKLRDYVDITNRIYLKLGKENYGYSGMLYKVGGSDELKIKGAAVSKREILIFVLLMFVAFFGTLVTAMMIRWLKRAD
ncbi:hypothetical protein QP938_05590 [Porticoccaceae bacterium LTM1]|nr:hypothetical protein QP938_05590 [Porticoccaceae bacterium LTM1]